MTSQSVSNWPKLNVLLDQIQNFLQKLLLRSWKVKFGREWDENSSAIILDSEQFQNLQTEQRRVIQEAQVSSWDLTILSVVLTAKHFLCLPVDQITKITRILSIQNKIAHFEAKVIPEQDHWELWEELQDLMVYFFKVNYDVPQLSTMDQILNQVLKNKSTEEQINEAGGDDDASIIKDIGNTFYRNGDYLEAIRSYSQGISLPGIQVGICAILYSNRCAAYLMLHNEKHDQKWLDKGEEDAKKAIELRPNWWKGHFRLGRIYAAAQKYEMAEFSFNEALTRNPENRITVDTLNDIQKLRALRIAKEYSNSSKILCNLGLTTSVMVDVEKYMKRVRLTCENSFLGYLHWEGLYGFPCDVKQAAIRFKLAADDGNALGLFNFATMLLNGEGVDKDFASALKLLRKAAAQAPLLPCEMVNYGVADAEHALGLCYEYSFGVDKNMREAVFWYMKSNDHGCLKAANNLGLIHELGLLDGKPDLVQAEQFYKLAVKSRWGIKPNCYAMLNLAHLYEVKGDYEKALQWCHHAKKNGNVQQKLDIMIAKLNKVVQQFDNSGAVEWEKRNNKSIDGLTIRERSERFSLVADSAKLMTECRLNEAGVILTKTKFETVELEKCAAYSVYGRILRKAQVRFLAAVDMMVHDIKELQNLNLEVCKAFIGHLSAAAKTETLVIEFDAALHAQAASIVTRLLSLQTAFDQDVRVCYAILQPASSSELLIQFLTDCLKLYPKDCFFLKMRACVYAVSKLFKEGLHDINLALKVNPQNFEFLYERAAMMENLLPAITTREVVNAFKDFLIRAPEDHHKYPDVCYTIAAMEEELLEAKKYYEMGLASEKKQLRFFLPCEPNSKERAELKLSGKITCLTSETNSCECIKCRLTKFQVSEPTEGYFCQKLSDPNRIALITRHRTFINSMRTHFVMCPIIHQPSKVQTVPQSAFNLKAISLKEMYPNKDHIYKGRFLAVTIIDELGFFGTAIDLVLEDMNRDVERCCIYNSPHGENKSNARMVFRPGCKMHIINPYLRIGAVDGFSIIRVDEPSTLIMDSYISNMCRYCTKPEATRRCSHCKNALYCDKNCQTLDWKLLKHKLVCFSSR